MLAATKNQHVDGVPWPPRMQSTPPILASHPDQRASLATCLEGTDMSSRRLVALPVYNEARHVDRVLDEVRRYSREILVVDDGSSDGTAELLARRRDVRVV